MKLIFLPDLLNLLSFQTQDRQCLSWNLVTLVVLRALKCTHGHSSLNEMFWGRINCERPALDGEVGSKQSSPRR